MTKAKLEELVLKHAESGMEEMRTSHGSFHQMATIVDNRGKFHLIGIMGEVLHGSKMAGLLEAYARSLGGADAILVSADARVKTAISKEESERIRQMAKENKYVVADDPANQEVLIVCGRSREHTVLSCMNYSRTPSPDGDIIVFEAQEPVIARYDGVEVGLIPNIWERVN